MRRVHRKASGTAHEHTVFRRKRKRGRRAPPHRTSELRAGIFQRQIDVAGACQFAVGNFTFDYDGTERTFDRFFDEICDLRDGKKRGGVLCRMCHSANFIVNGKTGQRVVEVLPTIELKVFRSRFAQRFV